MYPACNRDIYLIREGRRAQRTVKVIGLVVVSTVAAVVVAGALNSYLPVADYALAQLAPTASPGANAPLAMPTSSALS